MTKRILALLMTAFAAVGAFGAYTIDASRQQFFFEDESQVRLKSADGWFDLYHAGGNATLSGSGWSLSPDTYVAYRATVTSPHKTVKGWGLAANAANGGSVSIYDAVWEYNDSTNCTFVYDGNYEGAGTVYLFMHLRWFRYQLTFNSNGGSDVPRQTGICYTNSVALPTPTRTGYTFNGWTNRTFTTAISGSKTGESLGVSVDGETVALHAKWTANTHTVTFNANGGSVSTSSKSVTYDSTYGALPVPVRTGYSFNGWYTAASDGTEVKSTTKVTITANQTLYAHWIANTYTIKFNLNGGGTRGDVTATYGSWKSVVAPSRDGYVFSGWVANGHNTSTAYYLVVADTPVAMSSGSVAISTPGGASFLNLNTGVSGDAATTLTAQWTAKQSEVEFDPNGGTVSPTSKMVSYGSTYGTLPTPTRAGFTFVGWFISAGGNTQITESTQVTITAKQKLYAHWTANKYELGYDNLFLFAEWAKNEKSGVCKTVGGKLTKDVDTGTITLENENGSGVVWTGWSNSSTASANDGYYTFPVEPNTKYRMSAMLDGTVTGPIAITVFSYDSSNVYLAHSSTNATATGAAAFDVTTPANAHHAQLRFGVYQFGDRVTISSIRLVKSVPYAEVTEPFGKVYTYVEGGTYGTLASPTRPGHTFSGWFAGENGAGAQIRSDTANTAYSRTVFSKWTVNTYTITFNANGGTVSPTSTNITYGSTYKLPPSPTRTGFNFVGWFTAASGGTQVTAATKCTGDATIYAHWTAISYTVTFDANGGSVSPTSTNVAYNAEYGELPTPTKAGYTFNGWWTAKTGGTQVTSATKCTGNATVYAHWTVKQYKISFNANGGSVAESYRMVDYCAAYGELPTPTRSGHDFVGWFTAASGGTQVTAATKCTGNTTIYAHWSEKQSTVTFDPNGGAVSPTSMGVTYGSTYGTLPTPTRQGYSFAGWWTAVSGGTQVKSGDLVTITANQTLYAHWTANKYELGYDNLFLFAEWAKNAKSGICKTAGGVLAKDVNNGTLTLTNGISGTVYTGYSNSATPSANAGYYVFPVAANTKYRFSAMLDGTVSGSVYFTVFFYSDITNYISYATKTVSATGALAHDFTAPATATHAQLRFGVGKGGDSARISKIRFVKHSPYAGVSEAFGLVYTYKEGETYGTLETPTRTGYDFGGWFTGENGTGAEIDASTAKADESRTIYSKWTAKSYTVTFNPNGGTVSPATTNETYDSTYKLPTPVRTGYSFAGWWTMASGGTEITSSTIVSITSAQTLYAHWTPDSCKVTFNANGGTVSPAYTMVDYDAGYGELPTPTRAGHTFDGWWTAKTGGTPVTSTTKCTGDTTIYAHWVVKQYRISFNPNGGNVSPAYKMVDYCAVYGELPTPTRGDHDFAGWFTAASGGTEVTADTKCVGNATIYAHWTQKQYKLSFNANGGSVSPAYKSVTYNVEYGELPTATLSGYAFSGWFTAASGGTEVTAATKCIGNATVYAHWTANSYSVTFDANGGNVEPPSADVTYASEYGDMPLPTRVGYAFDGWYTVDGTNVTSNTTVTVASAHTLYAHWIANTYYVAYDANGGVGEMSVERFTYDQATNLQANTFHNDALPLEFLGWAISADGDVVYVDQAVVSNLTVEADATNTLYAVWGSLLTDLSKAADCNNLVLVSTNSDSSACWIVDSTGGYESPSSVYASGNEICQMTALISGTGVLTFKFKAKNSGSQYGDLLQVRGFTQSSAGEYQWEAIYANNKELIDGNWHDWNQGQLIKTDNDDVEVIWKFGGKGNECWIDQIKWMPDGSDSKSVEFDTSVAIDDTSKAVITNAVISHWDEILGNDAVSVSTIMLTGDDLTNAVPMLGLGFAPTLTGPVAGSTATMEFGGETRIAITSFDADDLSSMSLSAIVTNTVLGLPSWSSEAASVLGVWGATTLTSGWSRVECGEPDLSGYLTGGEVSWTDFAADTNNFFKVKAE